MRRIRETRSWKRVDAPLLRAVLAAIAVMAVIPSQAHASFAFSRPVSLAGSASGPGLATDAAGRTTVVWQERSEDGVTRLIQVARLAPDGTLGPPQTLTSMTSGPSCSCPEVVVDSEGRATVAWVGGLAPDDRDRMQAIQLDADGTPLGPVTTLSAADEVASWHQMGVDSQGRTTIVWRVTGSIDRVDSVRFLPDGSAEPVQTISEPGVDSSIPSIVVDHDDRATISWASEKGLQLVRIGADGTTGAVETVLPPEADAGAPEVAVDSEGRVTIAFWRFPGSTAKAVQIDPDGTVGPVLSLSAEGEKAFPPLLATDSADRITTVWESFSGQIKSTRIAADGAVGPVRHVSDPDLHRAGNPQLAMGPGDEAVVVWAHSPPAFIEPEPAPECEVGFEPESDVVQASFIGPDGLPGPIHYLSRFGEQSTSPAVAAGPSGRVSVVWHSFDGTYFCEDVGVRLQMSWGPWSPTVVDDSQTEQTDPAAPPAPVPSPPASAALRLAKRALARGRFVAFRGACLGPSETRCEQRLKLIGPGNRVLASGRSSLAAGTKRLLRLPLSRHGRELLARGSPRVVRATVEGLATRGTVAVRLVPLPGRRSS